MILLVLGYIFFRVVCILVGVLFVKIDIVIINKVINKLNFNFIIVKVF